jgi:uncharacterized repeat protein (TIGR03803 family)
MRRGNPKTFLGAFVVLACSAVMFCASALGQTNSVLYSFTGGSDGSGPSRALVSDAAGNLYGTTSVGGISSAEGGNGVVFELSPVGGGLWAETVLYSFAGGSDGYWPTSGVIFDAAGNLLGVTEYGGADLQGTVYELSTASGGGWTHTVLYSFAGGSDGAIPESLIFDTSGNLYGTTVGGGTNNGGTAFELSPATGGWSETVIARFPDPPTGPLAMDSNGNLYGTTDGGGTASQGSVYKLTHTAHGWELRTLYSFLGGTDGSNPQTGVSLGANSHLYGLTMQGGTAGTGTFFELVPGAGGNWTETLLYSFGSRRGDPTDPTSALTAEGPKTFWGASASGGTSGCGGIFNLTLGSSGWQERNVYESDCVGAGPLGVAIVGSTGDLFGPGAGGIYGAGDIYEFMK